MINKSIVEIIFGALLYALGHPTAMTLHPIPLFAPIGLFLLFKNIKLKSKKTDLFNLWIFCLSINIVGFYWIPKTIQTFGGLSVFESIPIFLIFSLLVLPQSWIIYFAFLFFKKIKIFDRKKLYLTKTLLIVVCISLLEYYTPSQFPVQAGHPWLTWWWTLGFAPIFGLIFYNFINYYFAFSIVHLFKYEGSKKIIRLSPIIQSTFLFALAIVLSFSTIQERTLNSSDIKRSLNIKVAQANIGNFMKVDSELGSFSSVQEVFDRYKNLSLSSDPADLIIWPETAYPYPFNSDILEDSPKSLPVLLSEVLKQTNAQMLIGAYDHGKIDQSNNYFQTVYNSTMLLDPNDGFIDVYHKKKLIPFGETLPLGPITPLIKDYVPGVSFFSEGARDTTFKTAQDHLFITPICYEILDPFLIRKMLNISSKTKGHVDFLINLTNDSWYGLTAEPYQHLFLAKWRAVEFQKPIIRTTNSGITSVIDVDGRESKRLLPGEQKTLDLSLSLPKRNATIFQNLGILSFLSLALLLILLNYFIDYRVNPVFKRS